MSCGRGIDFGSRLKLSQKPDPNMDPFYSKADQDTDPGPKPSCSRRGETVEDECILYPDFKLSEKPDPNLRFLEENPG